MLIGVQVFIVPRKKYTLSLARGFRLHYESLVPFSGDLCLEFLVVGRAHERLWEEIIVLGKPLLHAH